MKEINPKQQRRLHLHGTLGAGKSHLLAALVCLLKKQGTIVVYLPDCYELLMAEPPCLYVLTALFMAFHNDMHLAKEISNLAQGVLAKDYNYVRLEWEVTVFCNLAAQLGKTIYFIVDQTNVLDDGVSPDDRVSIEKKSQVRKLLDGISSNHIKISSSTANYRAAKCDEFRATSEERVNLYTGLDDVSTCFDRCLD